MSKRRIYEKRAEAEKAKANRQGRRLIFLVGGLIIIIFLSLIRGSINPLDSLAKSLPKTIGCAYWNGAWEYVDGLTAYIDVEYLNFQPAECAQFTTIFIPREETIDNQLILMHKEYNAVRVAAYFGRNPSQIIKLPYSHQIAVVDGLAFIALSPQEQFKLTTYNVSTWDASSQLNCDHIRDIGWLVAAGGLPGRYSAYMNDIKAAFGCN